MPYATPEQLSDRLTSPALASRVPEQGEDRARVLASYLRQASAKVDAVIACRYATPVPGDQPLLAACELDLAIWQIEADRATLAERMPARVQTPYEEAMRLLRAVASGELSLAPSAEGGPARADGASAGIVVESPESRLSPWSPLWDRF